MSAPGRRLVPPAGFVDAVCHQDGRVMMLSEIVALMVDSHLHALACQAEAEAMPPGDDKEIAMWAQSTEYVQDLWRLPRRVAEAALNDGWTWAE